MVRRAYATKGRKPTQQPRPRSEVIGIRQTLDQLAVARCPLCRMMLIARMGRGGPRFFCRCPKQRAA